MKTLKKWGRKVFIYMFTFLVLILVGFFMPPENFATLCSNVVFLAVGFFVGNGIEHVSDSLRRKKPYGPEELGDN